MRSARERLEAEVAGLQRSITTAHQDKADAQAEVADLQAELAGLRHRFVTAHQDEAEAKAELHRYGAATCSCLLLAFNVTVMNILLQSHTINLGTAVSRTILRCFVVVGCAHNLGYGVSVHRCCLTTTECIMWNM